MPNSSKSKYLVVFDTNSIYGSPFRSSVIDFIDRYSTDKRIEISFAIPEIVKLEHVKHYTDDLLATQAQYRKSIGELKKIIRVAFPNVKIDYNNAKTKIDFLLKKKKISVLPTPYKNIDLEKLIEKAVNYFPPFQEGKEKGFKDSIIIETILSHIIHLKNNKKIVFICSDKILREYAISISEKQKQLVVYESIVDFETSLKLHLIIVDEDFIKKITQEAAFEFSDDTNPEALFWKEKLRSKIYAKYKEIFENPDFRTDYDYDASAFAIGNYGSSYNPVETGRYNIANPVFLKRKSDNLFEWSTTVIFERAYIKTNVNFDTGTIGGNPRSVNDVVYHTLEFDIRWESILGKDEKIVKSTLLDIKHIKTTIKNAGSAPFLDYGVSPSYGSLPTTSLGQGTTPVLSGVFDRTDENKKS